MRRNKTDLHEMYRTRKLKKKATIASGFDQALDSSDSPPGNTFVTTSTDIPARSCSRPLGSHIPSIMPYFEPNSILLQPPQIHALDPDHVIQMYLFYTRPTPTSVKPFRSFPFSVVHAIAGRATGSILTLRAIYFEAKLNKTILDGAGLSLGIRLVDDFQRQITSTNLTPDTSIADTVALVSCFFSLILCLMRIVNTPMANSILRQSVPFFLTLAARFSGLWTDDASISIRHALAHSRFEFAHFAFLDTVQALVFGTAPLIYYDTTLYPIVQPSRQFHAEWVHGCSPIVIVLLARVNSWRAARFIDLTYPVPGPKEQKDFQAYLQEWNPMIEYGGQPTAIMGRLAVQESWKHAALIYMYTGMFEADSADPRVEASVRQVSQLAAMIEADHPLETHMTIPCIIAAAAARKEKHRAILRKKIVVSRDERVCLIRGADFVLVLDHLWRGAAAGGRPTTWEDYVESRLAVLPVEI